MIGRAMLQYSNSTISVPVRKLHDFRRAVDYKVRMDAGGISYKCKRLIITWAAAGCSDDANHGTSNQVTPLLKIQ